MYTHIFFDFDGTLYDPVEGITKCVRYALRKRGMDAELDTLRCFAGPPLTDMFMEKFGFSLPEAEQAVRDFRERYVPVGLYESRAFPGMGAFLRALRAAGKKLGDVVAVTEGWQDTSARYGKGSMTSGTFAMETALDAGAPVIQPGETEISASVTVTYCMD